MISIPIVAARELNSCLLTRLLEREHTPQDYNSYIKHAAPRDAFLAAYASYSILTS